jgi:fumarate reductase subunit D
MEAGSSARRTGGPAYGGASIAGAALATLFFPFISLIVALLLLGAQEDPEKRRSLRTWAWASAAWLILGVLLVAALWLGIASSNGVDRVRPDRSGPCVGGPDLGAEGKDISGSGTKFVVPCSISGTATVSFPNKSH